jgi:hypothetical protein
MSLSPCLQSQSSTQYVEEYVLGNWQSSDILPSHSSSNMFSRCNSGVTNLISSMIQQQLQQQQQQQDNRNSIMNNSPSGHKVKRRRKLEEIPEAQRWTCPGCFKQYSKRSIASIQYHSSICKGNTDQTSTE